jgi:hypothetical protein
VPEDLLQEFTGGTALSDLPEGFPPFVMPEGVLPIGSHQAPNQQMVLLRTSRGGAESQLAVANALMAGSGWIELASPATARRNGFVVPARALEPVTLCHDDHGIFEIRGEDGIENRVYIRRYAMANATQRPTCAQQNESRTTGRPPIGPAPSSLARYLPSFEALILPVEPSAAAAPSNRGDSLGPPLNAPQLGIRGVPAGLVNGGNRSFVTLAPTARFGPVRRDSSAGVQSNLFIAAGDRSLRTFRRLLADAMEAQGWELDSGWTSADTAASHWLRESDEDKRLLLRLHIARVPDDFYNVAYDLSELGD